MSEENVNWHDGNVRKEGFFKAAVYMAQNNPEHQGEIAPATKAMYEKFDAMTQESKERLTNSDLFELAESKEFQHLDFSEVADIFTTTKESRKGKGDILIG